MNGNSGLSRNPGSGIHAYRTVSVIALAVSLLAACISTPPEQDHKVEKRDNTRQPASVSQYGALPLHFEQNRGQVDAQARFISRGPGYALYLKDNEAIVSLRQPGQGNQAAAVIRMQVLNANDQARLHGGSMLPGKVNYLIGRNAEKWHTNIPTYSDVQAKEIYPGIDLRYHGDRQQLEYDFIVSPKGKVDDIKLHFDGVNDIAVNDKGDLVLSVGNSELHNKKPVVYQIIDGRRVDVEADYKLITAPPLPGGGAYADVSGGAKQDARAAGRGEGAQLVSGKELLMDAASAYHPHQGIRVGFEIASYNPNYDLIIDPILDYATYLGGEADDKGLAITVDDQGSAYVAGTTQSLSFPGVNPLQANLSGNTDTFIAKLNPDGDALVYATYLGGSGNESGADNDDNEDEAGEDDNDDNDEGDSDDDVGKDIAVDSLGQLVITGTTNSATDFPIVNAVQAVYGGGDSDAYVAKLSIDGSSLLYASYLGGDNKDKGFGIALDANDDVYLTGMSKSDDFPVSTFAAQSTRGGQRDAYVTKLAADGSSIVYSTYLGGEKSDNGKAIAVDTNGEAFITGVTQSKNQFPLANALQTSFGGGGRDAFVARLSSDGSAFLYSTYLGGSKKDKGRGIALDSQGNAIVTGLTKSNNFPLSSPLQSSYGGGSDDGFVSKINNSGSAFIFSTYLGGEKTDKLKSVAVDDQDQIYLVGETKSTTGIPTLDAVQAQLSGSKRDAFISKLNSDGDTVLFGSYLGGSKNDKGRDIAVDAQQAIYITGITKSDNDFPIQNALQGLFGGGNSDAFVAKIGGFINNQPPAITSSAITDAVATEAYSYQVEAGDPDDDDLTYTLEVFPTGMLIDETTGLITWTPSVTQEGGNNVTVKVDDGNGGDDSQSYIINVTLPDTTAPVITISSPDDGLITNQSSQAFTGSLSESANLTFNGAAVPVNPDLSFIVGPISLTEGSNSFTFQATDAANNVGTTTITLTLDTQAPLITVTAPQDGLITNQSTQTISGNINEAATLSINGQNVTLNPDLTYSSNITLVEGANSIILSATDLAGNTTSNTLNVTLDTQAPLITINTPQDGLITNQPAQTISGQLSESATLTINGQAVSVNPDLSYSSLFTLSEGLNTLTVSATDSAGNTGTNTISITLDTVAPIISNSSPGNGSLTNQSLTSVSGTLNEAASLTVNGQPVTVNPDLSYSSSFTLSEGLNSIVLSATDPAGNNSSQTVTVTLDSIAPVISVSSPVDGSASNQTDISVSGQLSELAGLSINGQAAQVNADGSFTFTPLTLVEGNNTITLIAVDAATNVGQTIVNVTLDTTPPDITVTTPVDGSNTNQAQVTITGSLNETATLSINGQSVSLNPDLTYTSPFTLNEGLNTIVLQATDNVGNSATTTINVTLDTVAPVISVDTPADNSLFNQADVLFSGSINEAVSLTINGVNVTQNPDNTYSTTITLNDGANAVAIVATDSAGNSDTEIVNVTIDATPPAAPDLSLINRGNPANGIVMVTGTAGAVEAGTLVHLINTRTGFEVLTLSQSDGSFSTDIAAFANDNFDIFTVDTAGNQSPTVTQLPNPPLTLTLDNIGNRIAPLGQTTRFTVTANDSSGDPITLGLTPVPLPAGMNYNIVTGELSFTPSPTQVGDIELTFSAQTGDERVTETITVTVPASDPAAPTVFTGRVLDATGMQQGSIVPLVGATISFLGTGVVTTTDSQGFFTLNNLPASAEVFDIDGSTAQPAPDGSGYASFREKLPLVQNVTNLVERPFFMPRLAAESLTTVDPAQTTVVTNTTLGMSLTVPPNTALNEDGTPFTGQLSISLVPRNLAPAEMPEETDPGILVTIQPVGVSFATPVPITFPNIDNLPQGAEVEVISLDPDTGTFGPVGLARVSVDGLSLETFEGGVRQADWHFVDGRPSPAGQNDNPDNPCNCPKPPFNSTVSLNNGQMNKQFTLPAYRSLEASRALTFTYQTNRARANSVVPFTTGLPAFVGAPPTMSVKLSVAGLDQGQESHIDSTVLARPISRPDGAPTSVNMAAAFDAQDFVTGIYPYELLTSNHYNSSRLGNKSTGDVLVENEQDSPFGAGWMLRGLNRLAFNLDGSILIVSPDGRNVNYRPTATPGTFSSPDNDFAIFIRNPDGSYTHTEKDGVRMEFGEDGLLNAHIDRNGNTNTYNYDSEGRLITITDPVGLDTLFVYDNNGLLQTVTDPANRTSTFEYDPLGNLTKIIFPDSTFNSYEYGENHLMSASEDERQNRYTYRYDAFGRVIDATLPDSSVRAATGQWTKGLIDLNSGLGTPANPAPAILPEDADGDYVDARGNPSSKKLDRHGRSTMEIDEVGRITEHERDADSNPTQTTRPIGSVVTRTFDNFGNVLTQREEFNTATTTYVYDQFSLVTSVTNPRSHTTTINRDPANGNPLSIVNHLGHTTTMVYNSQGLVTKMTSPNGLVTDYTYNTAGLMDTKTETPPAGSPGNIRLWTYEYFPTGLLKTVNTPDGITLNYTYDDRSFLESVTDNLNQSIVYTYDDHKNVIKTETTNADGSLALLVDSIYDNRNRLVETRAPHVGTEESITQRILDENSNLIGLIDPNGNPSSNDYDPFNRLEKNTHREGGITQYEYDDQDRIRKVTAPNGVVTDYEYDIISRRTKEISRDRGTLTYDYDLANNVTSITDGRGITATMTYDELERVSTKTYPNTIAGKVENVTYTYDTCDFGLGFLCVRTDESGSYSYDYDAYGNLTDMTFTEIEGITYTMNYQYDDGDHIIQMTMPSGRVVDYTRDGVRRLESISTTVNGLPQSIVSNIQYRGDNQMLSCDYGNGLNDTRTYDLQGRLLSQLLNDGTNTIDSRTYTYDKNSNILNINTNFEDNTYSYDKLDRLTRDTVNNNPAVSNIPIDYTYDLNDNRLSRILNDLSSDQIVTQVASSNRIQTQDTLQIGVDPIAALPNRDMVYNDVGRLFQLYEEGTLKAEYIYNDEGQRTRKTTYQADGLTVDSITIFHYDHMGYLITETTETGALIKDYIWEEGMHPVAQIDNSLGTENVLYLYTDHLMTNRLATDQTQAIVWRWEGEAFGNTPADEIGGFSINLRFPGQYFDQESNLFYNHFRYYDPILGRYITSDPIGLDAGNNTYVYTGDNPVNRIDPYGQYWQILTKLKRIWDGCKWGLKKIKDWIWKKDKDKPDAPSAPKPDADRIRRCNDAWLSCFRASVHNSSITEAACFASHSVCTTTTLPVIFPDGTVVK